MTERTHYETLGVSATATAAEIRSAYRRLVLRYHPDRSKEPNASQKFLRIAAAYEVLGNTERRASYDLSLRVQEARREASPRAEPREPPRPDSPRPQGHRPEAHRTEAAHAAAERQLRQDLQHLSLLVTRGRLAAAEDLARDLTRRAPREGLPYAVLGDLARSYGRIDEALRLYALAIQFWPENEDLRKRYEELLTRSAAPSVAQQVSVPTWLALAMAWGIVLCCLGYVAVSNENPMFPNTQLLDTWTPGLVVMLFVSGAATGAGMMLAGLLDRFQSTATNAFGAVTPAFHLGLLAMVNYWAAAGLYILTSLVNRASSLSVSRVVASTGGVVVLAVFAAGLSGRIEAMQVLLWGGNVAYLGTVVGWMIADALTERAV